MDDKFSITKDCLATCKFKINRNYLSSPAYQNTRTCRGILETIYSRQRLKLFLGLSGHSHSLTDTSQWKHLFSLKYNYKSHWFWGNRVVFIYMSPCRDMVAIMLNEMRKATRHNRIALDSHAQVPFPTLVLWVLWVLCVKQLTAILYNTERSVCGLQWKHAVSLVPRALDIM